MNDTEDRIEANLQQFIEEYRFDNERFKRKVDNFNSRREAMIEYMLFIENEIDCYRYSIVFDTVYSLIDYLPQYRSYVNEYQKLYKEMQNYIYSKIDK